MVKWLPRSVVVFESATIELRLIILFKHKEQLPFVKDNYDFSDAKQGRFWRPLDELEIPSVSCYFCHIPEHRLVTTCTYTQTVRDGFPVSLGHTLIITKRHLSSYFELSQEEVAALHNALLTAKNDLDKQYSPDGYNIGINDGAAAGQTIMHLHIHIIPRYIGDTKDPRGGIRYIFPDKARYWK